MKKLLYIGILTLMFFSCSDDFLDLSPSGALPESEAIQTLSDMNTLLLGAYSQLQNSDYYGRYFVLVPDVMADDVKQNSSANRAKEWAEYVQPIEPEEKNHRLYQEYFALYKNIYNHCKDDFVILDSLRKKKYSEKRRLDRPHKIGKHKITEQGRISSHSPKRIEIML